MAKSNEQLTSVKVNVDEFNEFKRKSLGTLTNLKTLVDSALHLYNTDTQFKDTIDGRRNFR